MTCWSERAVIVMGSGSGRGRALAKALVDAGAAVFLVDANPDSVAKLQETMQSMGGRAHAWTADIANRFQVTAMIERARECYGQISLLVNCTDLSLIQARAFLKLDEWDWRRLVDVNLSGGFFSTQLMARVLADEGGGAIVLCCGLPEEAENAATAATRAAIRAFAEHVDRHLQASGVRVACFSYLAQWGDHEFAKQSLALCRRLLAST